MNHVAFDVYVRRAAGLLEWRSLAGGLSAALSAPGGIPLALEAAATKKRVRLCRADLLAVCEGNDGCINDVVGYCKKAHKSAQKAIDGRENDALRDFRNRMRAIS
jgi:hypothetical protein